MDKTLLQRRSCVGFRPSRAVPVFMGGESEIFFSDKQLAFNFPGEIRFTTYLEICQIYSVAFSLG